MKLELKHLAPYLPYQVKCQITLDDQSELPWYMAEDGIYTLEGMMLDWYPNEVKTIKPILRPLSDLTQDNSLMLKLFVNADKEYLISNPLACDYSDFSYLLSEHFDVFGLIEKGLAINKNQI